MWPQAKESYQPPEAGRGKEQVSLRAPGGKHDPAPAAPRTVKPLHSYCYEFPCLQKGKTKTEQLIQCHEVYK